MAEIAQRRSIGLSATGGWIGHLLDTEKIFGFVLVAPAIAGLGHEPRTLSVRLCAIKLR
jgi:hypothetical protein